MSFLALTTPSLVQFMYQLISDFLEFMCPVNLYHHAVAVTRVNMENKTEKILGKQALLPPF